MILASHWDYFDGSEMRPIPKDLNNITNVEKGEHKCWDHKDVIAQCLLGQCLPIKTAMDMEAFPSVVEQWTAITALFTAKSMYNQVDLHQAFLDMRCPRGGNV